MRLPVVWRDALWLIAALNERSITVLAYSRAAQGMARRSAPRAESMGTESWLNRAGRQVSAPPTSPLRKTVTCVSLSGIRSMAVIGRRLRIFGRSGP